MNDTGKTTMSGLHDMRRRIEAVANCLAELSERVHSHANAMIGDEPPPTLMSNSASPLAGGAHFYAGGAIGEMIDSIVRLEHVTSGLEDANNRILNRGLV